MSGDRAAPAPGYIKSLSGPRFSTFDKLARGRIDRANTLRNFTLLVAVIIYGLQASVTKRL
jgi:hypothetical protein